jgi:hypothetical protein
MSGPQEPSAAGERPEVLDSIEDLEPSEAALYELKAGKYYYKPPPR